MTEAYEITKVGAAAERNMAVRLWEGNIGRGTDLNEKYDWLYKRNPAGSGQLYFLRARSGGVVGVAGIAHRLFSVDGRPTRAGVLADLVVDKAHRTMYPAIRLQRHVRSDGGARFDFLYGFPNAAATAVLRRMEYEYIGDIIRYAKVLRTREYIIRRFGHRLAGLLAVPADIAILMRTPSLFINRNHVVGAWVVAFDERFNELWHEVEKSGKTIGVRDATTLAWRYLDIPNGKYRIFVTMASRGRSLAGYIVCRMKDDGVVRVVDFLSVPGSSAIAGLFATFCREVRRLGYKAVSVEFMGDPGVVNMLQRNDFRPRGARPVFRYAKSADRQVNGAAWYLTEGDEDQ